jgi:hypothetical protein
VPRLPALIIEPALWEGKVVYGSWTISPDRAGLGRESSGSGSSGTVGHHRQGVAGDTVVVEGIGIGSGGHPSNTDKGIEA